MRKKQTVVEEKSTEIKNQILGQAILNNETNKNNNSKESKENEKLVLKLKYTDKKEYILDNLSIEKKSDGIGINLLSEDREGNYATFNLSKRYSDKNIRKILEKADYTCEK